MVASWREATRPNSETEEPSSQRDGPAVRDANPATSSGGTLTVNGLLGQMQRAVRVHPCWVRGLLPTAPTLWDSAHSTAKGQREYFQDAQQWKYRREHANDMPQRTPAKGLLTSACHLISLFFLLAASLTVSLSTPSQVCTPPHCAPSGGLAFVPAAGWRGGIFRLGRVL